MRRYWFLLCLLLLALVVPAVQGALTDDIIEYWTFDNSNTSGTDVYGSVGNYDGTITGSLETGVTGKINEAYRWTDQNEYVDITSFSSSATSYTVAAWVWYNSSYGGTSDRVVVWTGADDGGFKIQRLNAGNSRHFIANGGSTYGLNSNDTYSANEWHYIVHTYNASDNRATIYIDGILNASGTSTTDPATSPSMRIGRYIFADQQRWYGYIDEVGIWSRALSSGEVTTLYRDGQGLQYPFTIPNFQIDLTDEYSGAVINFTAYINGTEYYTSTGTLVTDIPSNSTHLWNITLTKNNYFNKSYTNYNVSTPLETTLRPYTNISATDLLNGSTITSFTINYTTNSGAGTTQQVTTTDGTAWTPLYNDTYEILIDATDYAYQRVNITADLYYQNYSFELYSTNSINFTFLDENTDALIDDRNVTAYLTSNYSSYNFSTDTGTYYIDLISPQTYTITYDADGYEQREYVFTLTNRTTNTLTLYLLNESSDTLVTINVKDQNLVSQSDLVVQAQRKNLTGTNYYIVESCTTDTNGQCAQHLILNDVTYRFVIKRLDGTVLKTTADQKILSEDITFIVQVVDDTWDSIVEDLAVTGNITYNNNTQTFTFRWEDPNSLSITACLTVDKRTGGVTAQHSRSCTSSASGTITATINTSTGTEYVATGTATIDDTVVLLDRLSIIVSNLASSFGLLGLFVFGFLVAGAAAFMGLWNPVVGPAILFVGLITFSVLGIINVGTTAIGGLAVVVVGLIYLLKS